jgi:hypothetical protein
MARHFTLKVSLVQKQPYAFLSLSLPSFVKNFFFFDVFLPSVMKFFACACIVPTLCSATVQAQRILGRFFTINPFPQAQDLLPLGFTFVSLEGLQ